MKEKVRFLGMDVHAETIAVAVAEPDGAVRNLGTIANRAESIRKLVKKLGPVEHLKACYEAGPTGPYDHVPPVPGYSNENTDTSLGTIPDIATIAVNADTYNPCLPSGGTPTTHCDLLSSYPGANASDAPAMNGFAAQLGFRLPNVIISPFTKKHYVSHTPMDHTAVIKFVENRFIGGSTHLTARDAAQPNLLEFFDFAGVPWTTPPTPPSPVTEESLGHDPCTPSSMGP